MSWSAKQYVTFENERNRPIRDLLAAVPDIDAHTVVDIGCGPGNSTEALMARFPRAAASGFDSSPDMIEAARKRLPHVHFEIADINAWNAPGPFDVILANAVFQWLPDHASLFPALVAKLSPGGSLAVQMPDNLEEPAHRLMREVAADGSWASKLSEVAKARRRWPVQHGISNCFVLLVRNRMSGALLTIMRWRGARMQSSSGSREVVCGRFWNRLLRTNGWHSWNVIRQRLRWLIRR